MFFGFAVGVMALFAANVDQELVQEEPVCIEELCDEEECQDSQDGLVLLDEECESFENEDLGTES